MFPLIVLLLTSSIKPSYIPSFNTLSSLSFTTFLTPVNTPLVAAISATQGNILAKPCPELYAVSPFVSSLNLLSESCLVASELKTICSAGLSSSPLSFFLNKLYACKESNVLAIPPTIGI